MLTQKISRDWLSIHDASRLLGVHIGTLREWTDAGILPSYRTPGGHRRFSASDLDSFLRQRKSKISPTPIQQAIGAVRDEMHAHPPTDATWFHAGLAPNA